VKKSVHFAVATAVLVAGSALAVLGTAAEARARPGPFPLWCPGDYWDPGWGDYWDYPYPPPWGGNWDWGYCGYYDYY